MKKFTLLNVKTDNTMEVISESMEISGNFFIFKNTKSVSWKGTNKKTSMVRPEIWIRNVDISSVIVEEVK